MSNLFKIEFYKLKKSKMFYFFGFLVLLQVLVIYLFVPSIKLKSGKETLSYMLFIQNHLSLNIIMGIFAADFIVTEFSSGYIKNLIAYGHKRVNIFISKIIVYFIGIIIISFIGTILATVINTVKSGYGETFNLKSIIFIINMSFIVMLIQLAVGSVSVLVAFASRNLNVAIGIVVAIDFINRIGNAMAMDNPTMKLIFEHSIFSQSAIVCDNNAGALDFFRAIILSCVTIFVSLILANYIFKRVEIK